MYNREMFADDVDPEVLLLRHVAANRLGHGSWMAQRWQWTPLKSHSMGKWR
jgi:hypothetical protein